MQNINFDSKNFCPKLIDKSTPLKKYLYCTKIKGLCKMVTYFPSGQIVPKKDVKNTGCPYGYVIQDIKQEANDSIEKNQVTKKSNVLGDISMKEDNKNNTPKQARKSTSKQEKETTTAKKESIKKRAKKRNRPQKRKKNPKGSDVDEVFFM